MATGGHVAASVWGGGFVGSRGLEWAWGHDVLLLLHGIGHEACESISVGLMWGLGLYEGQEPPVLGQLWGWGESCAEPGSLMLLPGVVLAILGAPGCRQDLGDAEACFLQFWGWEALDRLLACPRVEKSEEKLGAAVLEGEALQGGREALELSPPLVQGVLLQPGCAGKFGGQCGLPESPASAKAVSCFTWGWLGCRKSDPCGVTMWGSLRVSDRVSGPQGQCHAWIKHLMC